MGPALLLVFLVLNVLAISSIDGAPLKQETKSLLSERDAGDRDHEVKNRIQYAWSFSALKHYFLI